jgi:prepilin-type processing-associated H-X9-DG protein
LNYTIDIRQLDPAVSDVALSASTVPGVTVTLSPKAFTFFGQYEGIVLGISVDPSVNSSLLPVEITATTAIGVANASFAFTMDKGLVVVESLAHGFVKPVTMHVTAGQTVTCFDLTPVDDDGNGPVNITFLDGSASSPTLVQYDVWSHAFSKPGSYTYEVAAKGFGTYSGIVVVS